MHDALRCTMHDAMHGAMHGAPEGRDVHREAHPRECHSGTRWARRQRLEHSSRRRRRRRRRRRGRRRAATQPAKEHRRRGGAWAESPQPWAELGGERGEGRRLDPRCGDIARKADLARSIDLVVRYPSGAFLTIDLAAERGKNTGSADLQIGGSQVRMAASHLAAPREAAALLALRDALRDEDEVGEDLKQADVRRHLMTGLPSHNSEVVDYYEPLRGAG